MLFAVLSLQTCVCLQDLRSPWAPGCLQHQMSSCQRQSKSGKRAGRTSEERPAACSSAISAWESSYKKHLLHFVLSMMLWKINTVMVFLPLFSLFSHQTLWGSICVHANAGVASLVVLEIRIHSEIHVIMEWYNRTAEVSFSRTRSFWTKS